MPPISPRGRTGPLAALLVLGVAVVLVGLNLLEPPRIRVSAERLEVLLQQHLVEVVRLRVSEVVCVMTRPVRFRDEQQLVERVTVHLEAPPGEDDVRRWEAAGARVVRQPQPERRDWPWAALVALLLAGGIWHLVSQARRHRQTGSPRQRLLEADRRFNDGELSRKQYDELVSELNAEL